MLTNTQKALALFVIGAATLVFYFGSRVVIELAPLLDRTPTF